MNNKPKKKNKNLVLNILLIVFAAIFAVSGIMLAKNLIRGNKEQEVFEELSLPMHSIDKKLTQEEKNEILFMQYSKLKEQNPHFAGWIEIENTKLDYPVMHTPDDVEYYLRRSFDGSYAVSGTPFVGYDCTPDSRLSIIYGHHMNNGTMFATLHNYKDKAYWEKHPQLRFDTVDSLRTYDIVSAFYTEVDAAGENGNFDYYNYSGDVSDEDFAVYVENIMAISMYDTGAVISNDDRLVTLSTCSYHHENGRFVLVARLKDVVTREQ